MGKRIGVDRNVRAPSAYCGAERPRVSKRAYQQALANVRLTFLGPGHSVNATLVFLGNSQR